MPFETNRNSHIAAGQFEERSISFDRIVFPSARRIRVAISNDHIDESRIVRDVEGAIAEWIERSCPVTACKCRSKGSAIGDSAATLEPMIPAEVAVAFDAPVATQIQTQTESIL